MVITPKIIMITTITTCVGKNYITMGTVEDMQTENNIHEKKLRK